MVERLDVDALQVLSLDGRLNRPSCQEHREDQMSVPFTISHNGPPNGPYVDKCRNSPLQY